MTSMRQAVLVAAPFILVACSGANDSDSGAFCDRVGGTLTDNCAGCTISNPGAAVDGDLYSSADVHAIANAQSITSTLRATAPAGVQFAAGRNPGVFITDESSVCSPCGGVINTYLGGQLQESSSSLMNTDVNGNGSAAQNYASFTTTKPFDAVEIVDSSSGGQGNFGTTTPVFRIYEICSDGGVR